jgi:hypothetical protein
MNFTFVFFESVHQYAHSVIPELNTSIMKGGGKKWLSRMEREPLYTEVGHKVGRGPETNIPLTRLLLDSNFVSITDILGAVVSVTKNDFLYRERTCIDRAKNRDVHKGRPSSLINIL